MGASSAGGSRGEGGSGGAFGGGGLQTGTKWHGTKAHFNSNGQLKGYSTKGGAFKTPSGKSIGGGNKSVGQGLKSLPKPLEFTVKPDPLINPEPLAPTAFRMPTNLRRVEDYWTTQYNPGDYAQYRASMQYRPPQAFMGMQPLAQGNTGAYGVSLYNNPRLGTPGLGTGLGQYAGNKKDQSRVGFGVSASANGQKF